MYLAMKASQQRSNDNNTDDDDFLQIDFVRPRETMARREKR